MGAPYSTAALVLVGMVIALLAQNLFALGRRRWNRARALAESLDTENDPLALAPFRRGKATARDERIPGFTIRPLAEGERARFGQQWTRAQVRFMDSPLAAVLEADQLVTEVIQARGYPTSGFDQRAAGLSLAHPSLVHSYQMAHDLAVKGHQGRASTEDLRQSMVHYRLMVDALVEPLPLERLAAP